MHLFVGYLCAVSTLDPGQHSARGENLSIGSPEGVSFGSARQTEISRSSAALRCVLYKLTLVVECCLSERRLRVQALPIFSRLKTTKSSVHSEGSEDHSPTTMVWCTVGAVWVSETDSGCLVCAARHVSPLTTPGADVWSSITQSATKRAPASSTTFLEQLQSYRRDTTNATLPALTALLLIN